MGLRVQAQALAQEGLDQEPGTIPAWLLATVALAAVPVVLWSEYTLKITGMSACLHQHPKGHKAVLRQMHQHLGCLHCHRCHDMSGKHFKHSQLALGTLLVVLTKS